jgi:subtilisin family serine protease
VIIYESVDANHYLISVDSSKVDDLWELSFVEALAPFYPALKINPGLLTTEVQATLTTTEGMAVAVEPEATEASDELAEEASEARLLDIRHTSIAPSEKEVGNLELVLFDDANPLSVIDAVRDLGARVIRANGNVIIIFADMQQIPELAVLSQVREINPFRPPVLHNNMAAGIINVDVIQNDHELDGRNQIVAVADSGLDTGVNDGTMLADFQGRIVSIYALGRPGDASDIHNHGTHVTGSVLGDGANSNGRVRGMAPEAQLVFQSTMDANRNLTGIPSNLGNGLFDVARDDGARIHTNSWGADVNGAYNVRSTQADTFAFNNREFLILFSAGNDAPNRVGSPGTAKNVLTVGASESVRPLPATVNFPSSPSFPGGATWPNFDQQADDQNDVATFSSRGPAQNNRRKPDVVAPGSWILSTRSSVSTADTGPDGIPGTGDEDGTFTHAEAVGEGLPGQPVFGGGDQNAPDAPAGSGPAAADNYMYSSGTSMATPVTAGACALVRQYLMEQRGHVPSAALLKALMVNGAVDMGMGIPDNDQGWGRISLDTILFPPGTNRIQFDDDLNNAVSTGDIRSYDIFVSATTAPLVTTLVWRDPAGSTIQNRLHLRVIHVDSGIVSTADNITDIRNNVQKVIVDPPQVGLHRVEIEGVSVGTGVPELFGQRQDYALVVASATGFSCNPSDIVQVIDRSGSMGFSGYMEPAKERAMQMIDILQINDRAGVVTFNAAATETFSLSRIDSQDDKDDAHAVITPVMSGGATDLREALDRGRTTLGNDEGRPRAMVFLSDGKHTVATPPIDDSFLAGIAAANVNVYTIALGPASDFAVLNNIANRTGTGAVYTVESAADLHKLHEIYYDILGGIGCGGVIHLTSSTIHPEHELTQSVAVDATANEAHFALSWERAGAAFEFELEDPSGHVYHSRSDEIFYFQGSTHAFYRVAQPEAGWWKMRVQLSDQTGNQPLQVTTAALADTDVTCEVQLDPKYLYHNKVLLYLRAHYDGTPLVGGKAVARITYPTQSIDALLKKYADELEEIRIDEDELADDASDEALIRLDLLATRYGAKGKDIFERRTTDIELRDDGEEEDPRPKDGIYTAFFDPKQAGVAGNFQAQVLFEVEDEFGTHTCSKLVPIHVPRLRDAKRELTIGDLLVRRNKRWEYTILGVHVYMADGTPATPDDGVRVHMTLSQEKQRVTSGDLPYYTRGQYFIWRLPMSDFEKGDAKVNIQVKLREFTVVASATDSIRITP